MLIAIALVTVGRISSKKARSEQGKHLRVAIFYLLALLVMLAMMPWPFTAMGDGRGWI
jgi:L-asparagine transporter-like permease